MPSQITIHLDEQILQRARYFMSQQELSQFFDDMLLEKVIQLEQAEESQMREGYIVIRRKRQKLSQDWQILDGEGWPA